MAAPHLALLVRAAMVEHPGRELAFLRERDVPVRALRDCASTTCAARRKRSLTVTARMTDKQIADMLDAVEAREILKV